jgi:CheY-like chemotaxis protein
METEFAPNPRPGMTTECDTRGTGPRIVLVDVRSERRAVMRTMIDAALSPGTVVLEVASVPEALAAIEPYFADAVVIEVQIPLIAGLAGIADLRAAYPALTIVVCTFHADRVSQVQATDAGADAYLVKPVSARDLRSALRPTPRLLLADSSV